MHANNAHDGGENIPTDFSAESTSSREDLCYCLCKDTQCHMRCSVISDIHPRLSYVIGGTKDLNCSGAAAGGQTRHSMMFYISRNTSLSWAVNVQSICCIFACEGWLQFCIGKQGLGWHSETLKMFSNCRFPPSSPLKSYPKKLSCGKEVIKFPDWNEPKAGPSQEHVPVKSIAMVRHPVLFPLTKDIWKAKLN